MTRTFRLALATAAVLALMAQAAQAKPLGPRTVSVQGSQGSAAYVGTYRPIVAPTVTLAPDRVDRIGVAAPTPVTSSLAPPDRVDKMGTSQQRPVIQPTTPVVVHTVTSGGFNWTAALIGATSVIAAGLLAAAALGARAHRREGLSA